MPRVIAEENGPEALLLCIAESAQERVAPRCKHFGQCGGCQLQHIPYTSQVAAKTVMLRETLSAVRLPVDTLETRTAEPWRYRNRARFRVEAGAIGYSQRASHEFLAITECLIVSPLVWRAAEALQEITRSSASGWPPGAHEVEIAANSEDSALQLSLHLNATVSSVDRDAPRTFRALCEHLSAVLPELAGAGLSVAAAADPLLRRRLQNAQRVEIARWGASGMTYVVDSRAYTVTRNAFFQVNRFLVARMVQSVMAQRSGRLALDVFAGAGLFSVPLTERYEQVLAVEIAEPAASDLAAHLHNRGGMHRGVRMTASDFLMKSPLARECTPDLIVLDPPRAGLNLAATNALVQTAAETIVYVSCDAATFARDAKALVQSGYTLASLQFFDLFPQTFHTETIAVFRC